MRPKVWIIKLAPWKKGPLWEADNLLFNQEIPFLLQYLKFHYSVHRSLPLINIVIQMNPFHNPPLYVIYLKKK
jgi:hypothetical protein